MATRERLARPPMEKPPTTEVGIAGWLRHSLFGSPFNALLTVLTAALVYFAGRSVVSWSIREADWRVIPGNLSVLLWGRYPSDQAWRLGVSLGLLLALGLMTWWVWRLPDGTRERRGLLIAWLSSPVALILLLQGFSLPTVATITNNIGYYILRPEVLPVLGQTWRAGASVTVTGILTGLSWGVHDRRSQRALSSVPVLVLLALLLPLGLQMELTGFGLRAPRIIPWLALLAISFLLGRSAGVSLSRAGAVARGLPLIWIVAIPLLIVVLTAFDVGVEHVAPAVVLPIIEPQQWSGMMLTLVLALVSILASFPLGVLLALGRRSDLPIVKVTCVLFIELVRGVPLITILFMAQVMLPLFLPLGMTVDRVVRAMAGMTLFTAAYLAEVVRGGLQAVRHEQVEAARALGLSEVLVTGLVVLPQALRVVIPPIMGQFVSIFKDTSLVAIVGLLDLLAVGQSVIKQREFLGAVREIYLFAGLFYFVISYAMSQASRRLERRLGIGEQ